MAALPVTVLDLPPEIHLSIASYLPFPAQLYFRKASRLLYTGIPHPTHAVLLDVELEPRYKKYYACGLCLRLRPWQKFTDTMRKGKHSKDGSGRKERICVDCGIVGSYAGRPLYQPGSCFEIMKVLHVMCMCCREVGERSGDAVMLLCERCSPPRLGNSEEIERAETQWQRARPAKAGNRETGHGSGDE